MPVLAYFHTSDPLVGWRRRLGHDGIMLGLFALVMLNRLTENPLHEIAGLAAGLAAVVHMALNRRWYVRRSPELFGRGTAVGRRIRILVNLLLTAAFAVAMATGLACSQTLFAFLTPDEWRMSLDLRTAHVALSCWFFLLAGIHTGMHADIFAGRLGLPSADGTVSDKLRCAGFLLASAAVLCWSVSSALRREYDLLLGFQSAYVISERGESVWLFAADVLTMFACSAAAVMIVMSLQRLRLCFCRRGGR